MRRAADCSESSLGTRWGPASDALALIYNRRHFGTLLLLFLNRCRAAGWRNLLFGKKFSSRRGMPVDTRWIDAEFGAFRLSEVGGDRTALAGLFNRLTTAARPVVAQRRYQPGQPNAPRCPTISLIPVCVCDIRLFRLFSTSCFN